MPPFDPQKHPFDHAQGKHRRSIRLRGYDYSQAGAYFVTMVTRERACLFGEVVEDEMILNHLGKIADECWRAIPEHFPQVELGAHAIMPNHAHGIIIIRVGATHCVAPTDDCGMRPKGAKPGSLGAIIGSFKSAVSYHINKEHHIPHVWQRNYYEHIIRNQHEMDAIWNYIENNPSAWAGDAENPKKGLSYQTVDKLRPRRQ